MGQVMIRRRRTAVFLAMIYIYFAVGAIMTAGYTCSTTPPLTHSLVSVLIYALGAYMFFEFQRGTENILEKATGWTSACVCATWLIGGLLAGVSTERGIGIVVLHCVEVVFVLAAAILLVARTVQVFLQHGKGRAGADG